MLFDLVPTHSLSRTRQHRLSNESNNGDVTSEGEHVCSSILCQRIHCPEPDNIGYRMSQIMALLFGGQNTKSLVTMRHNIFSQNVVGHTTRS